MGEEELVWVTEEFKLTWVLSRFGRRCWNRCLTVFGDVLRSEPESHEDVLARDRIVTLEHVLVVRIPPSTLNERIVVYWRVAFAVAVPQGGTDPPSVFDRYEVVGVLTFRRIDASSTGKAGWGEEKRSEERTRFWPGRFGLWQGALGRPGRLKTFGLFRSQIRRVIAKECLAIGRILLTPFEFGPTKL